MLRFIWRQRRRILFTGFFGSLSLMLMTAEMYGGFDGIATSGVLFALALLLTGLIVAFGVMVVTTVFILLLPRWRQMTELLAFATFLVISLRLAVPAVFDLPYIGGFLPIIFYMFIFALTYGEILDRFRLRLDHKARRTFTSPLSAETLWRQLVPGEADTSDHWDPLLYDLAPDPEDPESYIAKYTHGASMYEIQTMTFLEKTAPYHAKYWHVGEVNPKNRSLVEGILDIGIAPKQTGSGCRVTLTSSMEALLPRQALAGWFDDDLGDRADYIRARQQGKRDWSLSGLYRRKVRDFA